MGSIWKLESVWQFRSVTTNIEQILCSFQTKFQSYSKYDFHSSWIYLEGVMLSNGMYWFSLNFWQDTDAWRCISILKASWRAPRIALSFMHISLMRWLLLWGYICAYTLDGALCQSCTRPSLRYRAAIHSTSSNYTWRSDTQLHLAPLAYYTWKTFTGTKSTVKCHHRV